MFLPVITKVSNFVIFKRWDEFKEEQFLKLRGFIKNSDL